MVPDFMTEWWFLIAMLVALVVLLWYLLWR